MVCNCRNKLFDGKLISPQGATLLVIIFVTPSSLALTICLGSGLEQTGQNCDDIKLLVYLVTIASQFFKNC